ncbi:HNH endonuclease [Tsukamurella sp. M9C]|uniref:HNH endonuclease signature motif containing protein n=1 Tax=Tsukamurella sp. M9C TaxID=2877520 RepID=UPI001CCF602F|nr:HNH endonuclease signature motif containing protein [Tsukamurella sp. M9C]MCA0155032.1 HNH endonuclease [Tsukamurella sp. M9C]
MSYSDDAFALGRRVATPLPAVFDGAVSGLSAAGAVTRLRRLTVEQNRLEAERAAVLTRLYDLRDDARRVREETSRRFVDDWDELVAEVGAALGIGRTAAGSAVHRGLDLRERCPRVFELFAAGVVSPAVVREVLRASAAVVDEDVALAFDERITAWLTARSGQSLSVRAVTDAAKGVLVRLDPAAARETPPAPPRERLEFHTRADGLVDLEAVMPKHEALRLSALIGPVAQSVCRDDGRTLGQRQVAALVALAEGYEALACLCGKESCDLRQARPRTGAVSQEIRALAVIVLNESDLADAMASGTADAADAHDHDAAPPEPDPDLFTPDPDAEVDAGDPDSSGIDAGRGAVILTGDPGITGPVTVEQAREMIAAMETQWRVVGRRNPATGEVHARGAGGYRPTWYQLLVMRLTYPTCVFPGCSTPSDRCQADHVTEYDHHQPTEGGATTVAGHGSPGNLVPLCGFHHRIKTETGWLSDLLLDGTVEWRHPAGGVHTVPPGTARDLLPGLERIIWDVPEPAPPKPKNPDGLTTAAKRRAKARRALRAENQLLRHRNHERQKVESEVRQREHEHACAESAGEEYDDTAPLQPPPF